MPLLACRQERVNKLSPYNSHQRTDNGETTLPLSTNAHVLAHVAFSFHTQIQQPCLFSLAKSLQRPNFMLSSPCFYYTSKRMKVKRRAGVWMVLPLFLFRRIRPHWLGVPLARETNAGEWKLASPASSLSHSRSTTEAQLSVWR